jgi:hypothetical protein
VKNQTTYEDPIQSLVQVLRPLKDLYHGNGSFFSLKPNPMKTHENENQKPEAETVISLKPVIDQLITAVLPASVSRRNLIVNDIASHIRIPLSEVKLALVAGNIINNIVSMAYDDCLHICYLQSGEIVFRLENTNLSRNRSFVVSLEAILVVAERLGIKLKIDEFYGKGSDVSVQFLKKAA